jgi:hypothetical protein
VSLYTAFHKFYVDKNRKPSDSDAFDIIIASDTPYVEGVVTEGAPPCPEMTAIRLPSSPALTIVP